jgi:hypothetical protein
MLLCTIYIILWCVVTRGVQEILLRRWRQDVSPKHCYPHNSRFVNPSSAGTIRDSCAAQDSDERNALYLQNPPFIVYSVICDPRLIMTCLFQVISLEGWTDIMYYVQDAHSFWDWIYFVLLIVVSVLCLILCPVFCSTPI